MPKYDPYEGTDPWPWADIAHDRGKCPVEHAKGGSDFNYLRVNSYDLVKEVSRRFDDFSNKMGVQPSGAYPEDEQVLEYTDPPDHTWHRQLIGKAFSVAAIDKKAPRIQQIADDLVDDIAARGNSFNLRMDFSRLLPAQTIAELLGVPTSERAQFIAWSEMAEEGAGEVVKRPGVEEAEEAFLEYSKGQLQQRIDEPRDDLLSVIINATVGDKRLNLTQGAAMVRLLLTAGNGTTSTGISNIIYLLETHPDQKAQLLADMDRLLDSTIEEGFRFDCPVQGNLRGVKNDAEVGGAKVSAGDWVYAFYGSANHDPSRYDRPDEFVIDRDWARAPRHFAFGYGIHFCLGSELAREETRSAIRTLYTRLPNLRMEPGFKPRQVPGMTFRTWAEIPMIYDGDALPRLSPRQ